MGPESEPTPEKRREDLIYLADSRQLAREAGKRLDQAFEPDTMTGLSFFLHPDGPVYLAAIFDPKVDQETLRKAHAILSEFCQETPTPLEHLLERAYEGQFSQVYIGAANILFIEK